MIVMIIDLALLQSMNEDQPSEGPFKIPEHITAKARTWLLGLGLTQDEICSGLRLLFFSMFGIYIYYGRHYTRDDLTCTQCATDGSIEVIVCEHNICLKCISSIKATGFPYSMISQCQSCQVIYQILEFLSGRHQPQLPYFIFDQRKEPILQLSYKIEMPQFIELPEYLCQGLQKWLKHLSLDQDNMNQPSWVLDHTMRAIITLHYINLIAVQSDVCKNCAVQALGAKTLFCNDFLCGDCLLWKKKTAYPVSPFLNCQHCRLYVKLLERFSIKVDKRYFKSLQPPLHIMNSLQKWLGGIGLSNSSAHQGISMVKATFQAILSNHHKNLLILPYNQCLMCQQTKQCIIIEKCKHCLCKSCQAKIYETGSVKKTKCKFCKLFLQTLSNFSPSEASEKLDNMQASP